MSKKKSRKVNLGFVGSPTIANCDSGGVTICLKPARLNEQHKGAKFTIAWHLIRNLIGELRCHAGREAASLRDRATSIEACVNPQQ